MAALARRAAIVQYGDYYLTPLPLSGTTGADLDAWITAIGDGNQIGTLIRDAERLVGGGDELPCAQQATSGTPLVTWERQETVTTRWVGRGRRGANRPTQTEVQVRYQISTGARDAAAVARHIPRLGWRVQVTNLPEERMTLAQAVRHYRGGWWEARGFHLVKDRPVGLRPLYVPRDDQIVGLTRLVPLAWRLLPLMETHERRALTADRTALAGLYDGQPNRTTQRPTATRLSKAIARTEITLTRMDVSAQSFWHLTPLPEWVVQVLGYLGRSVAHSTRLLENSS